MKNVPVDIESLRRIVEETSGFDIDAVGKDALLHAASSLAARAHVEDPEGYTAFLESSTREREKLIERLLVHETWFFRDEEPFFFLRDHVRTVWLPLHSEGVFSVLSAPCATGEEAYSAVMALIDEGVPTDRFRVDAADVSRKGVETARRAVYGRESFREKRFPAPDERFAPCGDGFRLDGSIARLVNFSRGDVLDPEFLADRGQYDAIFCRNLIVYLVREAREKVFATVDRLLAPGGVLFAGSAEVAFFRSMGYAPVRHPRSFACLKPPACAGEPSGRKSRRAPDRILTAPPVAYGGKPAFRMEKKTVRKSSRAISITSADGTIAKKKHEEPGPDASASALSAARDTNGDFARAERLADAGMLEDALEVCGAIIRAGTADAGVYALMGVITHALDRPAESEEYLLKAVYLDPSHYDALLHLSLLYRERGDMDRAALFRDRARRQHEREETGETDGNT